MVVASRLRVIAEAGQHLLPRMLRHELAHFVDLAFAGQVHNLRVAHECAGRLGHRPVEADRTE